ncbi:MAG: gamma-glutamylcyclotransferase family protein [Acidiferrobacterales bacterium]
MALNLFTYGVLMHPELLRQLTGISFTTTAATLPDYQRYALKQERYTPIPAAVWEPGTSVSGMLIHEVDDASFLILDDFEDVDLGLYVKEVVSVVDAQGRERTAVAYVAGPEAANYLEGLWDPEDFLERYLEEYRTRIIPEFLRRW